MSELIPPVFIMRDNWILIFVLKTPGKFILPTCKTLFNKTLNPGQSAVTKLHKEFTVTIIRVGQRWFQAYSFVKKKIMKLQTWNFVKFAEN